MVTTWLRAHRSHIPPAALDRQLASRTSEASAAGRERRLREGEVGSRYATPIINVPASEDSCSSTSPPGSMPWLSRLCTSASSPATEKRSASTRHSAANSLANASDWDGDLLPERIYTWPDPSHC